MTGKLTTRMMAWTLTMALCLVLASSGPAWAGYDEGLAYFKQGKFVEAAAEWEQVVTSAPDYEYGYFMLGNCYLKLKKYREAETQYRKAVELNSAKFDHHMMLAQSLLQSRKYNEVVVTLDKAESLVPEARKGLFFRTRGLALARVKEYGRAATDLKRANPAGDYTVALELGRVCFAASNGACVEDALGKALAKKPGDKVALEFLTKSHIETARRSSSKTVKRSEYGKAVKTASQLAKANPDLVEAHELLGAALLGSDDYTGSVREFETVLSKQPRNCNAMLNIAQATAKLENWNEMLRRSQQAAQCDPKSNVALTQIAFVHNKKKDWDKAEQAARKSLQLSDSPGARQQLQHAQDGRNAQAANAAVDADEKANQAAIAQAEADAKEAERIRKEYATITGKEQGGDDD